MSLSESASQLLDSAVEFPRMIADVAAQDPVTLVLVATGAFLITAPVLALGYLTAGAFISLFTVESSQAPHREAR